MRSCSNDMRFLFVILIQGAVFSLVAAATNDIPVHAKGLPRLGPVEPAEVATTNPKNVAAHIAGERFGRSCRRNRQEEESLLLCKMARRFERPPGRRSTALVPELAGSSPVSFLNPKYSRAGDQAEIESR